MQNEIIGTSAQCQDRLLVIIGPTAVGKTEVAIQLALRLGSEIVSADSRLFYKGMDIGTAKPSLLERQTVPHHLIDVAQPDEIWSLATFQEFAHKVIREIQSRNAIPILVGGTGQYIRAVLQGWKVPAVQPNPALRLALEAWAGQIGAYGLHMRLESLDPGAASKIDPRNLRRTVRALEVIYSTGQPFSEQRQIINSNYRTFVVGLNRSREELYKRIDDRIDAMIQAGLVVEVERLLTKGYSPDLPSLSAIGYREIIAYLQQQITLEEAIIQMKRNTRIFVRRQANWFKLEDQGINWFQVTPDVVEDIEIKVRSWLVQAN